MFYRRKLLLGLIEAFGGSLKRTDCQKLLFVFSQVTQRNYYDFFPYHYGSYSIVANYDKECLTHTGLLSESDDFQLSTKQSFLSQLDPNDRSVIDFMAHDMKGIKGRRLIRRMYLEYPQFTCRSQIISDVLTPSEIEQVKLWWNTDSSDCLFTIGYEGATIDSFLNVLIANNILAVVDVRNNPVSMKYGFSKTSFKRYVESADIAYYHLPELGIPSAERQGLGTPESYRRLFAKYAKDMLPKQKQAIQLVKDLLSRHRRIALVCFESDPQSCHRHKITEHLSRSPSFATRVIDL
jgi:uncharacterized protein (DUF488 family)